MFLNETKILTSLRFEASECYVIAVDEVGRGAGAGPVVVCASLWTLCKHPNVSPWLKMVADSKLLTPEQREKCFSLCTTHFSVTLSQLLDSFSKECTNSEVRLTKPNTLIKFSQKELKKITKIEKKYFNCLHFSLGISTHQEVDKMNIWNATQLAANRALLNIQENNTFVQIHNLSEQILLFIDGHMPIRILPSFSHIPQVAITDGDSLLKTIGFSSIIAKVCRDQHMINLAKDFPEFGFESHKGYLTPQHKNNLKVYGASSIHRISFLTNII